MEDFVYDNPPLAEVVFSVYWKLQPISLFPGAAIDPHFELFSAEIRKKFVNLGFAQEEVLVQQVPIEILGHKPVFRFRTADGKWPLYQVGPGILTINTIPPYDGWKKFVDTFKNALNALWETYPLPNQYLKSFVLELKYINAFNADHGFQNASEFIQEGLKFGKNFIPQEILKAGIGSNNVKQAGKISVPLVSPSDSMGSITFGEGLQNQRSALLVEIAVRSNELEMQAKEDIFDWAEKAHTITRAWFETIVEDKIKATFGTKRKTGALK